MLQLATFMQVLLDTVPNPKGISQSESQKGAQSMIEQADANNDIDESDMIAVENIEVGGLLATSKLARKSFDFGTNKNAPLNMDVAEGIIEVCRQGGKLSSNTVMKLLRRTYALLKVSGNTRKISVPSSGKVTIVGDLHGQLADLLHILDESGLPSSTNRYIFNGDFVDRGDSGVEITCILMSLFLAGSFWRLFLKWLM